MADCYNNAAVLATCAGITEADVRNWQQSMASATITVRAWNHRLYLVRDIDAYRESLRRG